MPDLSSFIRKQLHHFDVIHLNGYRNLINQQFIGGSEEIWSTANPSTPSHLPVIVNTYLLKKAYDLLLGSRELHATRALVVGQESEKAQALALGFPEGKIEIIHNGIDLDSYFATS